MPGKGSGERVTGLERTRRSIRGEATDRIPSFPILIAPACRLLGVPQRDYALDPRVMADTLLGARDMLGFDGIYVSRDNWVMHEALGGEVTFPEDDEPFSRTPLLGSIKEHRRLSVPDPYAAPGMKTVLAAARNVAAAAGNRHYLQANIDSGPFGLAAVLRGTQEFLLDISTENERQVQEYLAFCAEVTTAYGRAMAETGVHGIQFGDSTASLVSPLDYRRFVLPLQERVIDGLLSCGCDLWIHICGRTEHVLPLLRDLPIQGFEVDALVDLGLARSLIGERIALKGNLDTSFLLHEPAAAVYAASRGLLDTPGLGTRFILSPGCGVPRDTPAENLRAMVKACEDRGALV